MNVLPLDRIERAIYGCHQLVILRKDWPDYRAELERIAAKWDARMAEHPNPGVNHVGDMARIAIAKHDEEYAKPGDPNDVLAPPVGTGMIFSTRRAVIVSDPPDPASLV